MEPLGLGHVPAVRAAATQLSRCGRTWRLVLLPLAIVALGAGIDAGGIFADLRIAIGHSPEALPSIATLPPAEIARGVPLLSLYVDPHDLHDAQTGLLPNKLKRGPEWERAAWMSYFDEQGQLRFASGSTTRRALPRPMASPIANICRCCVGS